MKQTLEILFGSCLVYGAMAACSAGAGGGHSMLGQSGATDLGGASTGVGGADSGGVLSSAGALAMGAGGAPSSSGGATLAGGSQGHAGTGIAGSSPVPDAMAETSGTRLKAKWLTGSDGSKQFENWHDTLRNEDCYTATAADGAKHCLPITAATAAIVSGYTDSGCTSAVYGIPCSVGVLYQTVSVSGTGPCNTTSGFRLFNAIKVPTPTALYTGTPTNCVAMSSMALATLLTTYQAFASLGSEIPASTFVQFSESIDN